MPKFIDRTGEENKSLQGGLMRIIRYGSSHDCDVLFIETGYVARSKNYRDFTKGLVRDVTIKGTKRLNIENHNSKFIGRVYYNKLYNMNMTIIDYDKDKGASIVFDDKYVMNNIKLSALRRGTVEREDYIKLKNDEGIFEYIKITDLEGKVFSTKLYGDLVIEKWVKSDNITVRFLSDDTITETTWCRIKEGTTKSPNKNASCKSSFKMGETSVNNKGFKMWIKEYRSCRDIDVEFEDGTVAYNVNYYSFSHGTLRKPFNPALYIDKVYNNWEITSLTSAEDVRAKCLLCDTLYDNLRLYDIINGNSKCCKSCSRSQIMNKRWDSEFKKKIGSVINGFKVIKRIPNKGWLVECIDCHEKYEVDNHILVDSTKMFKCKCKVGISYYGRYFYTAKDLYNYLVDTYKEGSLSYSVVCDLVNENKLSEIKERCEIKSKFGHSAIINRLNEVNIMNNGQYATIIDMKDTHDITVKFEDNTIVHGQYRNFKRGTLENPNLRLRASKSNTNVVVKDSKVKTFNILKFAYRLKTRKMFIICVSVENVVIKIY